MQAKVGEHAGVRGVARVAVHDAPDARHGLQDSGHGVERRARVHDDWEAKLDR